MGISSKEIGWAMLITFVVILILTMIAFAIDITLGFMLMVLWVVSAIFMVVNGKPFVMPQEGITPIFMGNTICGYHKSSEDQTLFGFIILFPWIMRLAKEPVDERYELKNIKAERVFSANNTVQTDFTAGKIVVKIVKPAGCSRQDFVGFLRSFLLEVNEKGVVVQKTMKMACEDTFISAFRSALLEVVNPMTKEQSQALGSLDPSKVLKKISADIRAFFDVEVVDIDQEPNRADMARIDAEVKRGIASTEAETELIRGTAKAQVAQLDADVRVSEARGRAMAEAEGVKAIVDSVGDRGDHVAEAALQRGVLVARGSSSNASLMVDPEKAGKGGGKTTT